MLSQLAKGRRSRSVKPTRPSRKDELAYKAKLLQVVRLLEAAVLTHVAPTAKLYAADSAISDAIDTVVRVTQGLPKLAADIAKDTAKRGKASADTSLRRHLKNLLGVSLERAFIDNPQMFAAVSEAIAANTDLIVSIRTKYLGAVQELVEGSLTKGLRHESLVGKIQEIGQVTRRRAKLIARDQVAKMNTSFTRVRHQQMGITHYTWSTSGDERVRDTHAHNDGKVFEWARPPADTGHPGEDVQCRCVAIPVIE